jgi:hypothetical protein
MRVLDAPIIVFGFDRPDYLETLCQGLLAQRHVRPDPARVHLMQDAVASRRTGRRYADGAPVRENMAVFRRHFPKGHVHWPPQHLGIAENILRGERLAFETLDSELAYFFEDDLEPGPLYLHALETMRARTEPHAERVAHFAAYGDHRRPGAGPLVEYRQLAHHWGFGLRRAAWRRIQDWLAPWWEEVRRNDYAERNERRILELWRTKRVAIDGVTQDAAKQLACADLGLARIGTDVCFARYIGERGQHFTPEQYRALGFDRMAIVEGEAFEFPPLETARLEAILERLLAYHLSWRETKLAPRIAELEDPDRLATAEDVAAIWSVMLDRQVVPPEVLEKHVGRTTFRALRRMALRSQHFRRAIGT